MKSNNIVISIVIPTYNRRGILEKALLALFNQDYPKDKYEIILVDDGSTDGTKEYVESLKKAKNFKYIWHGNVGRAANRNIGIRSAKGEIILFLDDDVIAGPLLLKEHYNIHFESKDPKLVVLGYTPFAKEIKRTTIVQYYEDFWKRVFHRAATNIKANPHWYVITNNLSLRKDFLEEVGLFDENFKNYSYEDTELGYRLLKNGMEIRFNKRAMAYHNFEIDLEGSCKQQFQSGYSAVLFYQKYPELKEQLSIDVATGEFDKSINIARKIGRFFKPIIYNNCSIRAMKKFVAFFDGILSKKILFALYSIIHWHYYLCGIKEGLGNKRMV